MDNTFSTISEFTATFKQYKTSNLYIIIYMTILHNNKCIEKLNIMTILEENKN